MATVTETTADQKLDLGTPGEKRAANDFDHLAENLFTSLIHHGNTLNELYQLKDELLQHDLPPNFLLQTLLLTSKTSRSYSDVKVLVSEAVRLIQQYSYPWDEKSELLKKLKNDYQRKQKQLFLAMNQLQLVSIQEQQMIKERRLNMWMKLYIKTMAMKSVGRRWKFRIEPFKRKIAKGGNLYDSDSDSEDETNLAVHHALTPSDIEEDELKSSDKANELSKALSLKLGDALKKGRFTDFDDDIDSASDTSPVKEPHPTVETTAVYTWTEEPEYDYYLMVLLYRPKGVLSYRDITCTVTLSDTMFTSSVYKSEAEGEDYQVFKFSLSDNDVSYLSISLENPEVETDRYLTPKLSIAVYPDNVANEIAALCSVQISKIKLNGDPEVVVPPIHNDHQIVNDEWAGGTVDKGNQEDNILQPTMSDTHVSDEMQSTGSRMETKPWEPDWEGLVDSAMIQDPEPVMYPLKMLQESLNEEEDSLDDDSPQVPIIAQVVKIQRLKQFEVGLNTQPWNSLMHTMGYKTLTETQTVALSALHLDPSKPTTPTESPVPPPVIEKEEGTLTAAEAAELALKHTEEIRRIETVYQAKVEELSKTLMNVKSRKQKEIEELEQALLQFEASKSQNKMKSPSELREMLSKKKRLNKLRKQGLPEWGKNLPDNFYERLELFAYESMKKNAEMADKIKREVRDVCLRQLASLHKLDPPNLPSLSAIPETDVCIPALFMPTPTSRQVIYNPRASKCFYPPGLDVSRVSQPPAIFKLPPIESPPPTTANNSQLPTLNLYDLSQQDIINKPGSLWTQSSPLANESPRYTPAPPPSACDYYLPPPSSERRQLFNTQQQKKNDDS